MKRTSLLPLLLALALPLTGCGAAAGAKALQPKASLPAVTAAQDPDLDRTAAGFGLDLLRRARSAGKPGENTCVSPLSVLLALSMTANGAAGDTLAQFDGLLAGGAGLDALNANCASLLADYAALEGDTKLTIADSLWIDPRLTAEDSFLSRCTDTYQAGVFEADFTKSGTVGQINQWIETHTGGYIKDAIGPLDTNTVMALVNAVYFEGKWVSSFDPAITSKDRDFYLADGSTGKVDLMRNGTQTERYLENSQAEGVLLPYQDGRLAFLALLPKEGSDLDACLAGLDGQTLEALLAGGTDTEVSLALPRFELDYKTKLGSTLQAMGLEDAFNPDAADFSAMGTVETPPLYLSQVLHGTYFRVDEEGTTAAAYTAAVMACGTAAPVSQPKVLTFDRPFVFAIVDTQRALPLFLGTFEAP